MHNRKRRFCWLTLAILAFAISSFVRADGLPRLTHGLTAIKVPVTAPELSLTDMDEEILRLSDLRGKVLVVNFWATWCPPCRREMGSLERLYQSTKDHGVEVLAVNIGEDVDTVFAFTGTVEPSPTFRILFDPDAQSLEHWEVRGLPTTYIVRPDGSIAYRAVGGREFDHPEIRDRVIDLIK